MYDRLGKRSWNLLVAFAWLISLQVFIIRSFYSDYSFVNVSSSFLTGIFFSRGS